MIPDSIDLRAPSGVVRLARHRAPTRTTSENSGRSGGFYGDEDSSTSGYGSVLLYVRKGLGSPEIVTAAVSFVREVQRHTTRRWTLVPMSHGWSDRLRHLGTDTLMRRNMPEHVVDKLIADTCAIAGADIDNGHNPVTALFPPTDIRSLYQGKTCVERDDLLVFVDREAPVFSDGADKTAQRMRRQVVLMMVALDGSGVRWGHWEEFRGR